VNHFEVFLAWLSPDAEEAGRRYIEIHVALTKIFASRGCDRPQELADLTLDRVVRKIDVVAPGYQGEPAAYIHGVAKKIFLEYSRSRRRGTPIGDVSLLRAAPASDPELERRHASLERCLDALGEDDRELILGYYREERSAKIEGRRALAHGTQISAAALRKRVQRIRERLKASLVQTAFGAAPQTAAGDF
jgi:DNA-directed RNA polymerase specialized sigma24 family protein